VPPHWRAYSRCALAELDGGIPFFFFGPPRMMVTLTVSRAFVIEDDVDIELTGDFSGCQWGDESPPMAIRRMPALADDTIAAMNAGAAAGTFRGLGTITTFFAGSCQAFAQPAPKAAFLNAEKARGARGPSVRRSLAMDFARVDGNG